MMTQSANKAKDGNVKVIINKQEYWIEPKDLKIDDKTLVEIIDDINKSVDAKIEKLQNEFDLVINETYKKHVEDVEKLNDRIDLLTKSLESLVKELSKRWEKHF